MSRQNPGTFYNRKKVHKHMWKNGKCTIKGCNVRKKKNYGFMREMILW